jgi:hypothetical protein
MKYRFLIILIVFLGVFISFRSANRDYKLDFKMGHRTTAETKYLSPPVDFDELPRDKKCCRHVITLNANRQPAKKESRKVVMKRRTESKAQRSGVFYTWLSTVLDMKPSDQTIFSVSLRVGA